MSFSWWSLELWDHGVIQWKPYSFSSRLESQHLLKRNLLWPHMINPGYNVIWCHINDKSLFHSHRDVYRSVNWVIIDSGNDLRLLGPSHYPNQCWFMVNVTLKSKIKWLERWIKIQQFSLQNTFQNIACNTSPASPRLQCCDFSLPKEKKISIKIIENLSNMISWCIINDKLVLISTAKWLGNHLYPSAFLQLRAACRLKRRSFSNQHQQQQRKYDNYNSFVVNWISIWVSCLDWKKC